MPAASFCGTIATELRIEQPEIVAKSFSASMITSESLDFHVILVGGTSHRHLVVAIVKRWSFPVIEV
jgi:hypothetical protein